MNEDNTKEKGPADCLAGVHRMDVTTTNAKGQTGTRCACGLYVSDYADTPYPITGTVDERGMGDG